jgi:hypothetical protein
MNRWTAFSIVAASVALFGLYFSGHERLAGVVGAIACVCAIVNTFTDAAFSAVEMRGGCRLPNVVCAIGR